MPLAYTPGGETVFGVGCKGAFAVVTGDEFCGIGVGGRV